MKRLLNLVLAAVALLAATVSCYDDSALKGEIDNLKERVTTLEDLMKTANQNISSLQDIIRALDNQLYVKNIKETDDGYVIIFSDGKETPIKNGHSPAISADIEGGVYYWKVDGKWLLDKDGKKIPVTGAAPEIKIDKGIWYVSTDGGKTWTEAGPATGSDGDSFFKNVTWDDNFVYIKLSDGNLLTLPLSNIMEVLKNIQSIVYVPDYDDQKITVNSAVVHYGNEALLMDQPTEITYQVLPSRFAVDLAESLKSEEGLNAWFDVRRVNTRGGGDDKGIIYYGISILDVVYADGYSGEITFKVLPFNIASQSFLDGGLKPNYEYGIAQGTKPIYGWEFNNSTGIFAANNPNNNNGQYEILTLPVWKYDDIIAYQNRAAFTVQLRFYHSQTLEREGDENIFCENEIASTFTTLYPNLMTPVEFLPGLYYPVETPNGPGFKKLESKEHQYLPYNVFRKDATTGEPGYRTILDGLTPVFVIDGKTVSAEKAYELGYFVPGALKAEKQVTINGKANGAVIVDDQESNDYIEVEMDPEAGESVRKAAIGSTVEGEYVFDTPFGQFKGSGVVEISEKAKPGEFSTGYDFLHLSYYTFNSLKDKSPLIQKRDFASNDGSIEWWTQIMPSYYYEVLPSWANEDDFYRVSFRHALSDYYPGKINFAELAFNVVDIDDNILSDNDLAKAGLEVRFEYSDPNLDSRALPDMNVTQVYKTYNDLWSKRTCFYYNTSEYPFIKVKGRLFQNGEEISTRFSTPKKYAKDSSVELDYSTFAAVKWVPFKELTAEDVTITLDEHRIVRVPLFQTVNLKDNRPNGVSYYVIKEGRWVIGNVSSFDSEAGTYTTGGNGYIVGVSAKEAYHFKNDIDFELTGSGIPAELKKIIKILYSGDGYNFDSNYQEGYLPWLTIDYTSEVEFRGTINIPVHLRLRNPWQPDLETDFTITIKGYENGGNGGNGGGASGNNSWIGSWRVSRQNERGEIHDTWVISPTPVSSDLAITGINGFTDQVYTALASVDDENNLIIKSQFTGTTEDRVYGPVDLLLSGQYNVSGVTVDSSATDVVLATGIMSDDGNSASLRPGTVRDYYEFNNMQFFGHFFSADGNYAVFPYDYGYTPLPQTITRISE